MFKKSALPLTVFSLFFFLVTLSHAAEYINVHCWAFSCAWDFENFMKQDDSQRHSLDIGGGHYRYVAPVYFPPSATGKIVKMLSARIIDNAYDGYVVITLYRVNLWTGLRDEVLMINSGYLATPGEVVLQDWTAPLWRYRIIDNSKFSWVLEYDIHQTSYIIQDINLRAVRIKYE